MEDILPARLEYGTLRKSAFGRTNLFLKTPNVIFREIRCSASSATRQACASSVGDAEESGFTGEEEGAMKNALFTLVEES